VKNRSFRVLRYVAQPLIPADCLPLRFLRLVLPTNGLLVVACNANSAAAELGAVMAGVDKERARRVGANHV
jgi:hypothetical protein